MADETPTPSDSNATPKAAGESGAKSAPETVDIKDSPDTAALAAEVADLKDRLLRTLAEMENLRRRTEREVSDQRQYAITTFARDMLTVSDNLRRAIAAVPAESRRASDASLKALIEGVEMTERGLEQTLTKFGVRQIVPKGEKFDPSFHQAMFEVPTTELAAGMVAEVVQPGYVIGERVLRPALVGVSKAAPKQQAPAPAEQGQAETAASDDAKGG